MRSFLQSFPSRFVEKSRHQVCAVRHRLAGVAHRVVRDPHGCARGDLPRGVRARQPAHALYRDQHFQPRRCPVDRLRHLGARDLRAFHGLRAQRRVRRADDEPADLAGHHHRLEGGHPSGAAVFASGGLRGRRHPLASGARARAAGGHSGILTGVILALSRAIGETAPLIMIGALTYVAFVPEGPMDEFTALPIQIFNWTSRPQQEFHELAAAGIIVLLAVLLAMNAIAVYIRIRGSRR